MIGALSCNFSELDPLNDTWKVVTQDVSGSHMNVLRDQRKVVERGFVADELRPFE